MNNINNPEKILLISSRADPAGTLIHHEIMRILRERPDLERRYQHRQFDERLIYVDGQSLKTDAVLIIFLSRHSSKDPRAVLTVHVTGNFGQADYGGVPGTLTPAAPRMMHAILNRLHEEVPEGYEVTYEATHHGPTSIPVQSCFVEVGSTETEWNDRIAAAAVARAVIGAEPGDVIPLAGFGGTHYAKRQTEITLTTRGGFGHIMPTRDLIHLDYAMFSAIITQSGAEAIYIDRKSVSRDELRLIEQYAVDLNIPIVGQSDLTGLKNLPFKEFTNILALAQESLPGSSVTLHALNRAMDPIIVTVSTDLIAEAAKVNSPALSSGLDLLPVAHLSGNGVAFSHIFITSQEYRCSVEEKITDLCTEIICSYYGDSATISGDIFSSKGDNDSKNTKSAEISITEKRFSPRIATELGITPGKDFGRLAAGKTLTIDDQVVTPDQVFVETVRKIRMYRDNQSQV